MENTESDIEFLRDVYSLARNKYRPATISTLLVAEAPPCNLDRYFYFEDVKRQDSLFLEIMGILYSEQKDRYLKSGRATDLKEGLLERFKEDGFWLLDLAEVPTDFVNNDLESCLPSLTQRLEKYINKTTPVILIKTNVYDLCYAPLKALGYNVHDSRMPFPGSGQQKVFREKFGQAVNF